MNYKLSRVVWPLLFAVVFIMTSCTEKAKDIQEDEGETVGESLSLTVTIQPTKTPRPPLSTPESELATSTWTVVAPTVTRTPEPTLTPTVALTSTPTPLPTATLTNEQISENLTELMITNAGCQLPCWWGIIPGETPLDLARENLATLGATIVGSASLSMSADWGVFIEFEVSNSIIQTMDLGGSYNNSGRIDRDKYTNGWQPYNLMAVLEQFGLPTQVLVYVPFEASPNPPIYHLLVFYEELGVEIDYIGNVDKIGEDRYRACPDMADIWSVNLFLYQPGYVEDVVERVLPASSLVYIDDVETVHETISWQQATGTTLESFYETFRATESTTCFEFESLEW